MKCPRCCSNVMREEKDRYGVYMMCLECGWTDNGMRREWSDDVPEPPRPLHLPGS